MEFVGGEGDEDEELRRAIALSLEHAPSAAAVGTPPPGAPAAPPDRDMKKKKEEEEERVTIVLSSEDEEEEDDEDEDDDEEAGDADLALAIQMSLQQQQQASPFHPSPGSSSSSSSSVPSASSASSAWPSRGGGRRGGGGEAEVRRGEGGGGRGEDVCQEGRVFVLNRIRGTRSSDANDGCIDIKQLVQAENLEEALMTSFGEDVEWLLTVVPPTIPLTLVRHWDAPDKEGETRISRSIKVIHPPLTLPGFGSGMRATMHAKLMLFRYRNQTLRVVITSANINKTDYDWVGQTIWYQDFPKKKQREQQANAFEDTLVRFLVALKADASFLREYDFSKAAGELVVSVPGYHRGKKNMDSVGHTSLRRMLADFVWPPTDELQDDCIYYQTSSLGALYESFVTELKESASSGIYTASTTTTQSTASSATPSSMKRKREEADEETDTKRRKTEPEDGAKKRSRGKQKRDGEEDTEQETHTAKGRTRTKRGTKTGSASKRTRESTSNDSSPRASPGFAILYPSIDTVRSAKPDYRHAGAGYLFLQDKHWQSKSFPRALFHDIWPSSYRPGRSGLLLHSKVMSRLATHRPTGRRYGWVYTGSHNLSAAAWGRLQKDGTQLFISNFEIGIMLKHSYRNPDVDPDVQESGSPTSSQHPPWEHNLPFMIPPPRYMEDTEPFVPNKYFSSSS